MNNLAEIITASAQLIAAVARICELMPDCDNCPMRDERIDDAGCIGHAAEDAMQIYTAEKTADKIIADCGGDARSVKPRFEWLGAMPTKQRDRVIREICAGHEYCVHPSACLTALHEGREVNCAACMREYLNAPIRREEIRRESKYDE